MNRHLRKKRPESNNQNENEDIEKNCRDDTNISLSNIFLSSEAFREITMTSKDRVTFNLTGTCFQVSVNTYDKLKRLSDESKFMIEEAQKFEGGGAKNEIFLERDPACFAALLHFCQQGSLHLPIVVCPEVFKEEMNCWGVELSKLQNCCFNTMVSFIDDRAVVDKFEKGFKQPKPEGFAIAMTAWQSFRVRVWHVLERPFSSRVAKAYFTVCMAFLIISLFSMIVSTHPSFRRGMNLKEWQEALGDKFNNHIDFFRKRFLWDLDYYDYDGYPSSPPPPPPLPPARHNISKRSVDDDETNVNPSSVSAEETNEEERPRPDRAFVRQNRHVPVETIGDDGQKVPKEPESNENHVQRLDEDMKDFQDPIGKASDGSSGSSSPYDEYVIRNEPPFENSDTEIQLTANTNLDFGGPQLQRGVLKSNRWPLTDSQQEASPPGTNGRRHVLNDMPTSYPSRRVPHPYHAEELQMKVSREKRAAGPSPQKSTNPTSNNVANSMTTDASDVNTATSSVTNATSNETSAEVQDTSTSSDTYDYGDAEPKEFESYGARLDFLDYTDHACLAFFTLDFLLRLMFCSRVCRFFCRVLNLADLIALLAGYARVILDELLPEQKYTLSSLHLIDALQICRFLRFIRLLRDVIGFRVLVHSVKASTYELLLLVMFLSSGVLVFSTLLFWCERSNMGSIPEAFWWAIVTMTTVGYGDMAPQTFLGKIVGSLCAISGVVLIAITIPVLVNNFLLFYGYSKVIQARQKEEKEKEVKEHWQHTVHEVMKRPGSGVNRVHVQPVKINLDDVMKSEIRKEKMPPDYEMTKP